MAAVLIELRAPTVHMAPPGGQCLAITSGHTCGDRLMRTFLAIELPAELRQSLAGQIERLDRRLPAESVRWLRPASIHLTLKFLGEIDRSTASGVEEVVEPLAAANPRMELTVGGFGAFPTVDRPRVLWVGAHEPEGSLTSLWRQLEGELAKLGFERERHEFTPHLTLGRVQRGLGSRARAQLAGELQGIEVGTLGRMEVGELTFFHSDLRPTGAVYTPLANFPLAADDA